jgi:hypothetical protein
MIDDSRNGWLLGKLVERRGVPARLAMLTGQILGAT